MDAKLLLRRRSRRIRQNPKDEIALKTSELDRRVAVKREQGSREIRSAEPRSLLSVFPAFVTIWNQRQLLWHLTVRNLRAQYKQSALGYAWLFINPLSQLLTLTFIFSIVFKMPSQGSPFILFLCVGLFPWTFFAAATSAATDSVVGSANLITAVQFPRELLVISAVLIRVVDFLAALLILVVALIYYGQPLSWSASWALLLFALQFGFTVGLALPLAALNLFFHDVRYLVGVVLNLWFFLTPIFYSVDVIPHRYKIFYELNPMSRFIGSYRYTVLHGGSPPATSILIAFGMTLIALIIGYWAFRRLEPRFADRV